MSKLKSHEIVKVVSELIVEYQNTSALLRSIHPQMLFMAATALSVEWGASNNTYEEYRLKSELVSAHDNVFVLADHSKIGKNATYCYCPITRIRGIVTDQKPPAPFADTLRQHGIALYCAEDEAK